MEMLITVLIASGVQCVVLYLRRKRYDVPIIKIILLNIAVTVVNTIGAALGSFIGGMSLVGMRLYGFVLLEMFAILLLHKIFRMELGSLGDYLAPAIILVCCTGKWVCFLDDCCYGIELYLDAAGNVVRFPSQIVELSVWAILALWLCFVEKRGKHNNLIWPIATFWFGILRFLVDFMRGNPRELQFRILGMPTGRFWSLVIAVLSIVYLADFFRKYRGHSPKTEEILRILFGL